MTILLNMKQIYIALSTGAVMGVGIILYYQYHRNSACTNRQLQELKTKVELLSQKIQALKIIIEVQNHPKRIRSSSYYSIQASSGDEDESVYDDAMEESELFEDCSTSVTIGKFARCSPPKISTRGSISKATKLTRSETFDKVDGLLEGTDKEKVTAYDLLCEQEKELNSDTEFLWRYAKASYLYAGVKEAENGKHALSIKKAAIYKSFDRASHALTLNTESANVHKWYAITSTGVGDYESTETKLKNGLKYKDHIERAIELNPKDPSSHYLLGRWLFAVYMLSWFERKAAATIFGAPISARIEDALDKFMETEKIDCGHWKDNMLHIGKCHVELKDFYTAIKWFDKAHNVPTVSLEDKIAHKELVELVNKYKSYRK